MIRIGHSIDIHQLVANRALKLGGLEIPHHLGLLGHSDADVVLHAVSEAIIGALCLGDLGEWFSDKDDTYKGIDSSLLLAEVIAVMHQKQYHILNIDVTILCEQPMLKDYKPLMKKNIATVCQINYDIVNIKATRGEKLGFIGREEGILAVATVLLAKDGVYEV